MDCVSEYIKANYDNSDKNRKDLVSKWENNRKNFQGNLFPANDTPVANQWKKEEGEGWRSTTFPGATHQKVISALAIVIDTLLSGGKIPYMYKPSPFNKYRTRVGGMVDPKAIQQSIDFMNDLTDQQLADCHADRSLMKNTLSVALYGWTYAKLVIKEIRRKGYEQAQPPSIGGITDWSRVQTQAEWKRWEEKFNSPHWVYVPVWDIFRDWETDNLTECAFIIQRQIINNWWLRQKMDKPFFINSQLEKAIRRVKTDNTKSNATVTGNEDTSNMMPGLRNFIEARVNPRQYLEWWGRIPRDIVEQFEKDMKDENGFDSSGLVGNEDDGDEIEICASSSEGEDTVRFVRIEPDMRPYVQAKWEDSGDEWMPRGVADNCQEMQNVLSGTVRGIEDNVKLAANVMLAIKERFIKKMPKDFHPGAKFLITEECDDVRKAIQQVQIADMSAGLSALYELAKAQLDDDSLVPKIAQGMIESVGQTAREVSIRQAQALKYLGMAIRNIDEGLIEPMIQKFYDINMNDPAIEQGKGNYIVQALGFSSFQNKTERLQKLQQALAMALENPKLEVETKIREIWKEIIKGLDCDPDQMTKSDEEKQQEAQVVNPQAALELEGQQAIVEKEKSIAAKNKADATAKLVDAQNKSLDVNAKEQLLNREANQSQPSLAGQASQPQEMVVQPAVAPVVNEEEVSGSVGV